MLNVSTYLNKNNLHFFGCLLLVVALPFSNFLISLSIIILVINWLRQGSIAQDIKSNIANPFIILCCSYFLIHIIGLSYTENLSAGFNSIKNKLPLLILPIVICCSNKINDKQLKIILYSFIASNVILSLMCIAYYLPDSSRLWFDKSLSIFISPIYFGLTISLSLGFLFYYSYKFRNEITRTNMMLRLLLGIYLLIFLALIQARGAILSIIILTFAISIYLIILKKNYMLGLWKLAILICLFCCYYLFSPNAKSNIQSIPDDIQSYLSNEKFTYSSTAMRLVLWEASLNIFKNNQYIGVGTGDVFTELRNEYLNRNPELIKNSRVKGKYMNCHNQAIQSAVGFGVIGIIFFLSMVFIPGIKAYQANNHLFLMTMLILFISMLTESILERQIGVTTFSFFCSLFYSHQRP